MPIVTSTYKGPPFYLINGHFETIIPSLRRVIRGLSYERERIETPDDDFLDIDWVKQRSSRLLVISHGLEGSADRHYVKGLAKLFRQHGWDVLAWNNRTCGGEMNRQKIMYHHGASYDLRTVIEYVNKVGDYKEIALAGISMGGAQTIRYLGEWEKYPLPENIIKAVAISAPCALPASAATLKRRKNRVYERRFLGKLKEKVVKKADQFPDIDVSGLDQIKTIEAFDDRFSGPLHGFQNAEQFYDWCNPLPFLEKVKTPLLIINALNDPLLQGDCYPYQIATDRSNVFLETPKRGGHVGFIIPRSEFTYSEFRTLEFLSI